MNKEEIYSHFVEYYTDLVMTKCENKNQFSLYYCKVGCLLCVENQYIILVVPQDNYPISTERFLSSIKWVSFQTRTLHKCPFANVLKTQKINLPDHWFFNETIKLVNKTANKYTYSCGKYPIMIELIDDNAHFSSSGTIKTALETYSCVVFFYL